MNKAMVLAIQNRISLLQSRGKDNGRIVTKLNRKLRKLIA